MRVKCKSNNIKSLALGVEQFAFGQDDEGNVDLTIGKEYIVYGIRQNDLGSFYLVLTDELNTELPWWIPADLFEVTDRTKPTTWKTDNWEGYGSETVWANPVYFDASADIEDGTPKGHEIFEKMKKEAHE
jgi:hypothetical protein